MDVAANQQEQQQQRQQQAEEDPEEAWRRWLEPDETAAALLQRTWQEPLRTGLPLIDRAMALRGGQVLEIASHASAGRTTALLHVAACCVLPREAGGVAYGGKAANVVLLDFDCKLDFVRLLEMLEARILAAQRQAGVQQPDAQAILLDSLSRFHLAQCASSFEALAALRTLGPSLDALAAAPGGLACLLVDNVAAHYYVDKAGRGPPSAGPGFGVGEGYGAPSHDLLQEGAPLGLYRVHAALAAEVRAVSQRHRVPVIATKHLLLPGQGFKTPNREQSQQAGGQADSWAHREVMMKPWQQLVTHRLLLQEGSGSGGVGAGGGAARQARWHTPESPAVVRFAIGAAGIEVLG